MGALVLQDRLLRSLVAAGRHPEAAAPAPPTARGPPAAGPLRRAAPQARRQSLAARAQLDTAVEEAVSYAALQAADRCADGGAARCSLWRVHRSGASQACLQPLPALGFPASIALPPALRAVASKCAPRPPRPLDNLSAHLTTQLFLLADSSSAALGQLADALPEGAADALSSAPDAAASALPSVDAAAVADAVADTAAKKGGFFSVFADAFESFLKVGRAGGAQRSRSRALAEPLRELGS